MKGIVCKSFGPPENMVFEEIPSRPVGPTEVRVVVKAAGVNFPDTLIIQGKYQFKAEPPFTPGAEVAGTVTEIG
ncbi:MAG: alcohol dehydrogenase catalytic domain-containing protein, partial [Stenotrophobium sp.]